MWGVETDAEQLLTGFLLVLPKTSCTCTYYIDFFYSASSIQLCYWQKKIMMAVNLFCPDTSLELTSDVCVPLLNWAIDGAFFSLILESITNPPTAICIVYYIGFKCSEIASNLVPVSYVSTNRRFWCRHAHHSVFYTSLRWRSAQHSMTTYALTNQNAC